MRLDKYLKVSRIIKRRTVANDACSGDRVMVNDKIAKPSYEVKPGDVIELRIGGGKTMKVEVVSVNEYASKADASAMYRALD